MTTINRDTLEAMLRSSPGFGTASVSEMRAAYDAGGSVSPADASIQHIRADGAGVPIEIGVSPGAELQKAILFLHGGGYVIGSTKSHRGFVGRLGIAAGVRTVTPDYRLAPEHPFPAAVDDAVAVYRWLLSECAPEKIALAGDSAGGGLVVAALVRARQEGLSMPAAVALFSPLVDLAAGGESMLEKAAQDPSVTADTIARFRAMYLAGEDACTPLASPIHADLHGFPPMLIHVGTAEVLLDDSLRLARRAAVADVAVELKAWPQLPHVWQFFAGIFLEGQQSIEEAGAFLRSHLASQSHSASALLRAPTPKSHCAVNPPSTASVAPVM